ncbi:MAG: hypothetical protein L6277_10490 [Desulfobacterales bacterium]|nr:hypothetical protein [Pseudomonadota bacterium]MCG2772501.1 hypothetical protein [Desulfobacterales bacterium]
MASDKLIKWDLLTISDTKDELRQLLEELVPLPGVLPVLHLLLRVIKGELGGEKVNLFKAGIEEILSENAEKPNG